MKENIKIALIEIKELLQEKKSISETDLQNIFTKNKLGIKDITIISNILDENNIEIMEDDNLNEDEPTINEIEIISKEENDLDEDEDLAIVKSFFSNYLKLDEDNLFELANIIKHSKSFLQLKFELKNWFEKNNIRVDINPNKLYEFLRTNKKKEPTGDLGDPVSLYLKEIGKIDLLSPKKERELAKKIKDFQELLDTLEKNTPEYENVYNEFIKVRNHFAEHNLRLVVSIAKHYIGRGVDFIDLIQEGNIGLERAIEKYDYTKGFKFSTYATWWIRQGITRAIDDQSTTIRIPVHLRERINRLNRITEELRLKLHRKPTNEEIIEVYYQNIYEQLEKKYGNNIKETDIQSEQIRREEEISYLQRITRENDLVSLDSPIKTIEDEDSLLIDFIEDKQQLSVEDEVLNSCLRENLNSLFECLSLRERITLAMRYGLYDGIITDEEKDAIATKIVIKSIPKEELKLINELNTKLNDINKIEPINLKELKINTYKDYLEKKKTITDYYKFRDQNESVNRQNTDYDKVINIIIDYNTISAHTPVKKSTINNNLNINTYLYLKEKYKDYYDMAYLTLTQGNSRTLETIAGLFGVTRERIRQIQFKSLRKLRLPSRKVVLTDYIEERKPKYRFK